MKRKFTLDLTTLPDTVTADDLKGFLESKFQDGATVAEILAYCDETRVKKRPKPQTIAASTIKSIDQVLALTGIQYREADPAHYWELSDDLDRNKPIKHIHPSIEETISVLKNSSFWHTSSAEVLHRTPIDLLLFDRLSLKQDLDGARNLVLKGEQALTTNCLGDNPIVSGVVDYALGYCRSATGGQSQTLESVGIVIEAKRAELMSQGVPQIILYLAAIQQGRKALDPDRIVTTVYGILTDSSTWQFFRLDGHGLLQTSKLYTRRTNKEKDEIYRFLDAILEASIESSPHTTPSKTFPRSADAWSRTIEQPLFSIASLEEIDPEASDSEMYDIVRSGSPSQSNVTV